MTTNKPTHDTSAWSIGGRVEAVCDRFEEACKSDEPPRIEDYLSGWAEPDRSKLLRELLLLEFEYGRRNGGEISLGDYESRFTSHLDTVRDAFASTISRPSEPVQPTSIGRYRIDRTLGKGGFGQVYLAYDEQLHREVAIKVPHLRVAAGSDAVAIYLAEARAVAQLDHPNIVPIYDVGENETYPCFLVSKYVEGTTLQARLQDGPPAVTEAVRWVTLMAEALDYAHSQGIVHRDIKPGNILLDGEDRPHLVDFGLAIRGASGDHRIQFAGTPAYMSPEQALGDAKLDGRSDVFSLGVVLYELLSGEVPFKGKTTQDLIEQVRSAHPRSLREVDGAIPAELERICGRALAKQPDDRYSSAKIRAADLSRWQREAAGRRKLVGRSAEIERATAAITSVLQGSGSVVVVSGEAGVGKSRFTHECIERCREAGMSGWTGKCRSFGGSVPYLPWKHVLRSLIGITDDDTPSQARRRVESRLANAGKQLDEWTPLLGTMLGIPVPDNPRTAALAPRQRREKIFTLCLDLLRSDAARQPVYVVLEDVHWIDPLSRELLDYIAPRIETDAIFIIATQRPNCDVLADCGSTAVSHIDLTPLDAEATTTLIRELLDAASVPRQFGRRIFEQTEGNPFFVEEAVRASLDAHELVRDAATGKFDFVHPAGLDEPLGTRRELVAARINHLPATSRGLLQVASVIGEAFTHDLLQAVGIDGDADEASQAFDAALQELIDDELIIQDESKSYSFRHAIAREVAYETLDADRRAQIHLAIGTKLEGEDTAGDRLGELAHHFDLGNGAEKAVDYLVLAGEKAKQAYANAEACHYFARAISHLRELPVDPDPKRTTRVLEDLGDVRSLTGDYASAVDCYGEVWERTEQPVVRARLAGKVGGVRYRQGQSHESVAHLEAGLQELGVRPPRTRWQIRASLLRQGLAQAAHTMLPSLFVRQRARDREVVAAAIEIYEAMTRISFEFDLEKCFDAHLRQLNLCETIPGSAEMAQTYSSHGIACGVIPRFGRAIRYQQRGLAIREAAGSRWGVAQSLSFMGVTYYFMGRREQSVSCLQRSRRLLGVAGGAAVPFSQLHPTGRVGTGCRTWPDMFAAQPTS